MLLGVWVAFFAARLPCILRLMPFASSMRASEALVAAKALMMRVANRFRGSNASMRLLVAFMKAVLAV